MKVLIIPILMFSTLALAKPFHLQTLPAGTKQEEDCAEYEKLVKGNCISNPKLTHRTYPEFPKKARIDRVHGKVVVEAVVKKDGTTSNIRVLQATPEGYGFEQSAIEAIEDWKYRPGTINGEVVDVYFTIIVTFELS